MRKMKQTIKVLTLFLSAVICFGFFSCDGSVGLGESVDKERPVVDITYPPIGAVIRDTFVLSGNVSDDKEVKSMVITLTHKETKKTFEYKTDDTESPIEITPPKIDWETGTTWQVRIGKYDENNENSFNGWDLPDGEYFVDVEAYDVEDKGQPFRRTLIIDNTPPVFILDNITSLGSVTNDDKLSVFGQKIALSGKIVDDSDFDKVFIDVYDENQKPLGSTTLNYSMSKDGIVIAQYKDGGTDELAKNYNLIYGLKDGEVLPKENPSVKTRYVSIRLSDKSRLFNDVKIENGNGEGNITKKIYLNTSDFGLKNLNIDDLALYEKGFSEKAEEIKQILEDVKDSSILETETSDTGINFNKLSKIKINPEINPKWFIGNYDITADDDYPPVYLTVEGTPLLMQFTAGNDNISFNLKDIRIVLAMVEESEPGSGKYTKVLATEKEIQEAKKEDNSKTSKVFVIKDYGEGENYQTLQANYSMTLLKENFETPVRYKFLVLGKDKNGLDFCEKNKTSYGIKTAKTAAAPEIKFITEDGKWLGPNDDKFEFAFNVKTDGEELSSGFPKVKISVQDNKGSDVPTPTNDDFVWKDSKGNDAVFAKGDNTVILKNKNGGALPMPEEGQNYKLQIVVDVEDINGGSAQKTFKINLDRKLPTVKISNSTPYIFDSSDNKEKLNGTVTIPVEISDDQGVSKAYYKASWESDYSPINLTDNKGTVTLDTVGKVTDGTEISLFVKAVDIYGNEKIEEKKFTVDQETDRPKLQFANLVNGNDSSGTAYTYTDNTFGLTNGNRISGVATDDDGNVDIKLKISGVDLSTDPATKTVIRDWVLLKENFSGSFDFYLSDEIDSKKLIEKDGKYELEFEVKDKLPGTLSTKTYTSGAYPIMVDGSAPIFDDNSVVVKISGTETEVEKINSIYYISKGKSAVVSFTLTEGNLESVKVNGSENGVSKKLISGSTTDWNVSYTWTPGDVDTASVQKDLLFVAKDSSGNEKGKTISLFYDIDEPVVNKLELNKQITTYLENGNVERSNNVNEEITIEGSLGDNEAVSKTEAKILKSFDGSEVSDILKPVSGVINTPSKFSYTVDTTILNDKTEYKFSVKTYDRAGNEKTEEIPFYVNQETDIPSIEFNNEKVNGSYLFGNAGWKLNGVVEDDDGAVTLYHTSVENSNIIPVSSNGAFEYTIPENDRSSGEKTVNFIAVDGHGEEKTVTFEYIIDTESPKFGVVSFYNGTYDSENYEVVYSETGSAYYENMFIKQYHKIVFDVSDDNEVTKVEIDEGNGNYTDITPASFEGGTKKTVSYPCDKTEGDYTVKFRLTDRYGYTSEKELKYKVDIVEPVVSGVTVSVSPTSESNGWHKNSMLTLSVSGVTDNNLSETVDLKVSGAASSTETFGMAVSGSNPKTGTFTNTRSFNDGESTVSYVFYDDAGNTNSKSVTIKVDTIGPTVSKTGESPYITFSSGTDGVTKDGTISLKLSASDAGAGLAKIIFSTTSGGNNLGEFPISGATKDYENTSIDISALTSGTYKIYARAVDSVGNERSVELGDVIRDTISPKVTYESHQANDTVNKKISLKGTVSDANLSDEKPVLYLGTNRGTKLYDESDGTNLIEGMTCSVSGVNWEFNNFNTEDSDIGGDGVKVLEVVFTDKAGNKSSDTITLKVEQDSDRPKIVLNSIKTDGTTTLNHGTIAGNITDDDGVDKFEIKLTKRGTQIVIENWKTVTCSTGGQFSYEVPKDYATQKADGNYTVWFRIKDNAGTTFESCEKSDTEPSATEKLSMPKISIVSDPDTIVCTNIDYDVDSTPPEIVKVEIERRKLDDSGDETVEFVQGDYYGGKLREKATLIITVKDSIMDNPDVTYSIQMGEGDDSYIINKKLEQTGNYQYPDEINFGSFTKNGAAVVTINATDKSGQPSTASYTIFVDNLAPDVSTAVTNFVPAADYEVTGVVTVTANLNDEETARSQINPDKVAYYIPTKAEYDSKPTTAEGWAAYDQKWIRDEMTVTEVMMKIELKNLAKNDLDIADAYAGHEIGNTKIYNLPLWIKVEDKMGNVTYVTDRTIKYNPDIARPKVKILSPIEDQTVSVSGGIKNYVILGGTIRLSGSAEDNEGVKAIFVQYDVNGDGKFDSTDASWIKTKFPTTKIYNINTDTEITNGSYTEDKWGIKATGTLSWNTSFDATKLDDPSSLEIGNVSNPNSNTFNIRVLALDTDSTSHVSAPYEIHVSINNSAPVFGQFKLKQYSSSAYSGTAIRTVDYTSDVFISGDNWRLEGEVTDPNGINTVTATNGNMTTTDFIGGKNIIFTLDTTSTTFETVVTAKDNETPRAQESSTKFFINIDNNVPVLPESSGSLILYQGTYGGTKADSDIHIQNSNGYATITSKITEKESGFDKLIFFLERFGGTVENKTNHRIYDVLKTTDNRINITTSGVHINEDNLPVYDVTDNNRVLPDEFVVPDNIYADIRVGSAVKIGGNYHLVAQKIDATKTIKFKEQIDVEYKTASVVYGNVVNTSGEIGRADSDGDGILEDISKNGSDYIWSAQFNSANIPDGPVWLHVVAFDIAGNMTHSYVQTRISNNVARITSVTLGTDLNGDDNIDSTEFTKFSAIKDSHGNGVSTEGVSVWNLVTSNEDETFRRPWVIRNGLKIKPEFVGGDGQTDSRQLYYIVSTASGTGDGSRLISGKKDSTLPSASGTTGMKGKLVSGDTISLSNTDLDDVGEDNVNTYQLSFWDENSDEESIPGSTAGWTVLNMELKQDYSDTQSPVTYVHPFYWKGKGSGKNSVPWVQNQITGKTEPEGHIELEADLEGTEALNSYGADPKVAGKIIIKGSAYDETKLTEVKIKFDGIITDETCVATYDGSAWTGTTHSSGAVLSVTDVSGISQKGHLAEWTLTVDTSKLSNHTGLDKKVRAYAKDENGYSTDETYPSDEPVVTNLLTLYGTEKDAYYGKYYVYDDCYGEYLDIIDRIVEKGEKVSGSGTSAVYEYTVYGDKQQYQMDIMPYVTEVVTSLSSLKSNNPSVFSRTSTGHYPVQSVVSNASDGMMTHTDSENVVLRGFNLSDSGEISFNVANIQTGMAAITVNNIPLMNNINNNDAKGDCDSADTESGVYQNCYNRTPNGDNNNLLTDDIYFDVWEFNDRIAEPGISSLGGTTMKVNSTNGLIQYAFSDGLFMRMADGNNSSQQWVKGWDTWQEPSIGFHVDARGRTVSAGHPSDTNGSDAIDRYALMTSAWGVGYTNGNEGLHGNRQNVKLLEGTGEKNSDGKLVIQRKRIWSTTFASTQASKDNVDSVNLYMAYYDSLNKEIRFRAGFVPATDAKADVAFDMYIDSEPTKDGSYSLRRSQLIANSSSLKASSRGSSQFVSLAATTTTVNNATKDVVCAVWYDSYAKKLRYSYKIDPMAYVTSDQNNGTAANWSTPVDIFSSVGGGEYCQIAIDAQGRVHIAAFAGSGQVYYAYATAYDQSFTEVCVDATEQVGKHLTLDVALDSNNNSVPYLGYYSASGKPVYAYLSASAASKTTKTENDLKGVDDNNAYTGNWVISLVPTYHGLSIKQEDKINVGVWKNTSGDNIGQLKDSKVNNSVGTSSKSGTSSTTYGNGTSNGVLVYQIVDSSGSKVNCLESAQLR